MSTAIALQLTFGFSVQHYTFRDPTLVQDLHDPFSAAALRGKTDMGVHNSAKAPITPMLFLPTDTPYTLANRFVVESPGSFPPLLPELGTPFDECGNES